MSSLDNIYSKMTPTLEPAALAGLHAESPVLDHDKLVGRQVAHELNNILTILRGYAERMMIKHGDNPALRPDLQLINDNLRRAERVIRESTPPRPRVVAGVGL
jgi:hypothetical protein